MLDFAGELNRFAVARATVRDMAAVQQCRDLVDGLMGQFLQVSSISLLNMLRYPCEFGTPTHPELTPATTPECALINLSDLRAV